MAQANVIPTLHCAQRTGVNNNSSHKLNSFDLWSAICQVI